MSKNTDSSNEEQLSTSNRIIYDNLSYLYLSLPVVLIWQWISALFMAILIFPVVEEYALMLWLLLSTIIFLYRYYHFYLFNSSSNIDILSQLKVWEHRYYADVLLSGIMWGSSAILIFPSNDGNYQVVMVLFVFMSSFIAMSNLASKFQLLLLYSLVTFVPLILRLLFAENEIFPNFGLTVIALMIIMVLISKYFGVVVDSSIKNHQNYLDIKHSHEILQERFFGLFERAPVGIVYFDKSLKVQDCNQKYIDLNRASSKESLLSLDLSLSSNDELTNSLKQVFNNSIGEYRGPSTSLEGNIQLYLDLNTVPLLNSDNEITGGIAILKDITEEINAKEKVTRNAYYDLLTNIPNRTFLMDNLEGAITRASENRHYGAVIYLDLDNFKKFNEMHGHEKGDLALKQVTTRILQSIHGSDILARISGDKFAILIPNLDNDMDLSYESARQRAERIKNIFTASFHIATEEFYTSASIGVYLFPTIANDNAYDALKRSEIAMYESKKAGKNRVTFYSQNMSKQVQEYIVIDRGLRKALENNELVMYYQPQIDVKSGSITSAEALVRWNHPQRGLISPGLFIPIAEESGYIIELSHWIIEQVIKDIRSIIDLNGHFPLNYFAININSTHFLSPSFEQEIKQVIEKHKVPSKNVELEITEGVIMQNTDEAIKKMLSLKEYGLKMSMDDFGTGYSSLSYLSKLPFDSLKIDQAFVSRMDESDSDQKVVHSIVELAKNFNMSVVAEGVEIEGALDILRKTECDIYQGYFAYKPMSFEEFKKLIL